MMSTSTIVNSTSPTNQKRGKLQRQATINESIANEHLIKLETLCAKLNTSSNEGLTTRAAKKALKTYGYNVYTKPKSSSSMGPVSRLFQRSAHQNESTSQRQIVDTSWTKRDWNRVFNSHARDKYVVIRDCQHNIIERRDLVPGDMVLLHSKQIVPADMRVINYEGELIVDNRIVTGNSAEQKSDRSTSNDFLLSQNMIFAGTEILSGNCEAIVVKTGNDTVFGNLTQFATKVRLTNGMRRFGSVSLSSVSSGSTTSIGPFQSRDDDLVITNSNSGSAPPSPSYTEY